MSLEAEIGRNLEQVRRRLVAACERSGRSPEEVTLLCVTKTVSTDAVRAAYQAGARDFGENYAQDLRDKAKELADLSDLRWHFIGSLQRNKAKMVVGRARLIHGVDSPELLAEIDRRAARTPLVQDVLLELNLAGEESKAGAPEESIDRLLQTFADHPHCRCRGLMIIPPFYDDPEGARPYFARLRRLLEQQSVISRPGVELRELSMGMSGDFEVAIEEGATIVRVGTAIFGARG